VFSRIRTLILPVVALSLVVGSFSLPAAASGAGGINAATVNGFHAVACTTNRSARAGKLMAVCKNGYLPNNIIVMAPNSAKLGGKTWQQIVAMAWKTTGNAGTNPSTNFLGTTDNQQLVIKVNGTQVFLLQPTLGTPNIIGGYSGNGVTNGVVAATIAGGGIGGFPNTVTDSYGTIGGGQSNQAGDSAGSTTDAPFATVGGGHSNSATGHSDTIAGGYQNMAQFNQSTVGGGARNAASGNASTVGGGTSNTASGPSATIPGGYQATASLYGQMAYASGRFADYGDAQTSEYVLRRTTTNATPTELFLDGDSGGNQRLTVASGRTMSFDALVVSRTNDTGGKSAGYEVKGLIENVSGTTAVVGTPTVTVLGEDNPAWDLTVQADDTSDALVFKGTGEASTNIRWVAMVKTAEVMFGP